MNRNFRWFNANQPEKLGILRNESSKNQLYLGSNFCSKLNPIVMVFMQQHTKWTEEQIIDVIIQKPFYYL